MQLPRIFLGGRVSPEPLLMPLDSILAFRGISITGLLPTLLPSARGGRTTAFPGLPPNDLADPSTSHVRGCRSVHRTSITAHPHSRLARAPSYQL